MKIAAICGSLRNGSYNRKLMEYAKSLNIPECEIVIVEIKDLPFFNQDLESSPPQSVSIFRKNINSADGVLFITPEHNYSIPAVLKNAIEWGSRPYRDGVLGGKPVAIMGGSNGMLGTSRAQYHFRQMCVQVGMYCLNQPEVMVPFVQEKFDENSILIDQHTKEKIKELLEKLVVWTKFIKSKNF